MEFMAAGLGLSLAVNGLLAYLLKTTRKKRAPDLTAQHLLHDLTRHGQAILRVEVIDPANLLLRSPRA